MGISDLDIEKFLVEYESLKVHIANSLASNYLVPYVNATRTVDLNVKDLVNIDNLGVGTDTPDSDIHIKRTGAGVAADIHVESSTSSPSVTLTQASVDWRIFNDHNDSNKLKFEKDGDSFLTINTSGDVGVWTTSPSYDFSVGSPDYTQQVGMYHNNSSAYFKTTKGDFIFQTDEGTNTNTDVFVIGKGTGYGTFRIFDQDNAEWLTHTCSNGAAQIDVQGSNPTTLGLLYGASGNLLVFQGSSSGETREVNIYGFRTGDALRILSIGVGVDAADTASFDGLSNYFFDGNVGVDVSAPKSTLDVGGSFSVAYVSKTSAYTATSSDCVISCDASGGAFTITLPTASGIAGRLYRIKKSDTSGNAVTIDPNGSETIDGSSTKSLTTAYDSVDLISDGTNWEVY